MRPSLLAPGFFLALVPLITLAVAGCFNDGGNLSAGTPTSAGETTSAGTTDETTTDDPSTSTTDATTTSGSPTTGETTSETTGERCECEPNAVEFLEPCDPCGDLVRTCTDACTWGEPTCADAEACDVWYLPDGAETWVRHRSAHLESAALAPKKAVEAAFSATQDREIMVLTADRLHVFDPATMTWLNSLPRDVVFPEAAGKTILHAYSTNHGLIGNEPAGPGENVALTTTDIVYVYSFANFETPPSLLTEVPCCAPADDNDLPSDPTIDTIHAYWADLTNSNVWAVADLAVCGEEHSKTPLTRHGGGLTADGTVYLQDYGICFEFAYDSPYAGFKPFTVNGAPPSAAAITALSYLDQGGLAAFGPGV